MSLLYFDFNRTTPLAPSVLEAMQPYWSTHYLLPGQQHAHAHAVSEALENARESVASMAGCESFEVVFTSGGTESNNLAILGALGTTRPGHVLVSEIEHESVLGPIRGLAHRDPRWQIERIPCRPCGTIDPLAVESLLREDTRLVCVQGANAILGTIQPVREIADRCHNQGIPLHCDATQMFGKVAVDVKGLRADTVTISGHKFYGPKGSGAVYIRRGLKLDPITFGEPREMGLRPGAENVPACIGLGAASSLAERFCTSGTESLSDLRDQLIQRLYEQMSDPPIVLCEHSERLPNTIAMELPGDVRTLTDSARELAIAYAQTSSPPDEFTRSLRAIGRSDAQIARTIRLSIGWTTSSEQIDRAADLIAMAYER
ncbi:cysteine desulfurase family protein [Rhodopirellula sp. MGV]|uniref:cysteine desulfurase family protein n=1 Tax=Rhodopirellula sp. MGV TaxID=2023130 RepID=UPI000B97450D|nr:cysteine desulfurase family protein [Rhodopirellula sp. MGV]OYP29424.1 cysteine desulfurase [Rhodopirellula sp. MGV]PNY35730.1 cysteine desulfurase [Rhodopirellula baltica]